MANKFEQPSKNKKDQEIKEEPLIKIVSPVGAEGRKISEEELKKSREVINKLKSEKNIKKEQEEEIIELTDVIEEGSKEYYKKEEKRRKKETAEQAREELEEQADEKQKEIEEQKIEEQKIEEQKKEEQEEEIIELTDVIEEGSKEYYKKEEKRRKKETAEQAREELEEQADEKQKEIEEQKIKEEISKLVITRFKEELNIKKEDLENIEGFNELSSGQQSLVLENLTQLALGRVHEEGLAKSKKEITDANFLGKIWKGITKKYQILKLEKATAKEIKEAGIKIHGKILEQLVKGMKEFNTEVEIKDGHLEIQYASGFKNLNSEDQKKVNNFNEIATKFSKIPDEWSKETASKKEQKKHKEAKGEYEQSKKDILNLKAEKSGEKEASLYMNNIENNIKLNQFLNTNPDVEGELKRIEDKKIWKKALKSIITERGIYAGAGFLTRTVTMSAIGIIGAPLAAAGMGGFVARKRAKETLREKEVMARKGEKDESKEAKDFVDAEYLHESIDFLINELKDESLTEDKKEEIMRSLKFHIQDAHNKIEDGTVNYGEKDVRLFNQYELIKKISEGAVLVEYNEVNEEIYKKDIEGIKKILKKQDKKISRAQKFYVGKRMMNGILMGIGFAAAGYTLRHFGEGEGWWGDDSVKLKQDVEDKKVIGEAFAAKEDKKVIGEAFAAKEDKKVIGEAFAAKEDKKVIEEAFVTKEDKKVSNIWSSKTVEKGESSLLIAKKVYIEHAEELGYKESMGDVKKWAEKFSTRHIIGQYISENSDDYKELINKIGVPPKDLVELDKWMSKVPASTFNDILNNKVPNLIHIGDTVSIDANGNINVYSPGDKLRMGNLPKDILASETISTGNFQEIDELFKKQGMEKVIEQVRAGKFNRRDFKEFLFDDARKNDNFISNKEKARIKEIMKIIDSKK